MTNDFFNNCIHGFFTGNTYISNASLKLAKNQAKSEPHPEPELLLFGNCLLTLPYKYNRRYSKKCIRNKHLCLSEVT